MRELAKDASAIDVTDLLTRYSFDLGGYALERVVESWLNQYPVQWVRLAVIEALYQGRYKAFSVEQILNLWQRRGRSLYRFTHEFERIVCGRFPNNQFIHHEAVHSAVAQLRPTKPSIVTPSIVSPDQPIVELAEPARISPPEEEILDQTSLPKVNSLEDQGISPWSPDDATPLLPLVIDEVASLSHFELANADANADTTEAELVNVDVADAENLEAAPEPEQLDSLIEADLTTANLPEAVEAVHLDRSDLDRPDIDQSDIDQSSMDRSDVDIDSTRPITRGGPVPTFKPATSADLELFTNGNWSNSISHQQPIHQFIPTPEPSDFYSKLRAVVLQSSSSYEADISHLTPTDREYR